MAIGLHKLSEINALQDDQIMHVCETSGVDVKIKVSDLKKTFGSITRVIDEPGDLVPGKNFVNGDYDVLLRDDYSIGEEIDIIAGGNVKVKQSNAEQSIVYKDHYYTTKGTDGYVQMKNGDRLNLIYKGPGYADGDGLIKVVQSSSFNRPTSYALSCKFSTDGKMLVVTTNSDPYIKVYEVDQATGRLSDKAFTYGKYSHYSGNKTKPASRASEVAFSPDGKWLAIPEWDAPYLLLYNVEDDTNWKVRYDGGSDIDESVLSCAFSPDSKMLLLGLTNGFALLTNFDGSIRPRFDATDDSSLGYVQSCAFSPDGGYFLLGYSLKPANSFYSLSPTGSVKKLSDYTIKVEGTIVNSVAYSNDGQYVAFSTNRYDLPIYHLDKNLKGVPSPQEANALFYSKGIAFSPNNKYFGATKAIGSELTSVYKVDGGKFDRVLPNAEPVKSAFYCAFSPDTKHFAVASGSTPYITIYNMKVEVSQQFIVTLFTSSDGDDKLGKRLH